MKKGRCPFCGASKIGCVEWVPDQTAAADAYSFQALGMIGYVEIVQHGYRTVPTTEQRSTKAETIEAYVCGRCGRVEYYLQEPQWAEPRRVGGFCWLSELQEGSWAPAQAQNVEVRVKSCAKCGSSKLGLQAWLPDTVGLEQEVGRRYLAVRPEGERRVGAGQLSALVCSRCGYLELYADVEALPFEELEGFSWLEEDSGHPYR